MKKNTALQKKYDNHKSAYEYYLNQLEDSKLTYLERERIRVKCFKLALKMEDIAELACSLGIELCLS